MAQKERTNKREKKNQMAKKESGIVTKESVFATCGLFSFLAFLILCTKDLVFGSLGLGIHVALMGLFGYLSYPIFLGAFYLSVMGLLGKSLVKNKKIGWAIGISFAFIALILHIAFSYRMFDQEGYLYYCFKSGESFPKTSIAGWLGALIAYGFVQLVSRVGAILIFALLAIMFAYIAVVLHKKGKSNPAATENLDGDQGQGQSVPTMEIPVSQVPIGGTSTGQSNQSVGTIAGQTTNGNPSEYTTAGNVMPTVQQRPGVSLQEEKNPIPAQTHNSFSPFGFSQTTQPSGQATEDPNYKRSREFLFGGTPAENYRMNLLFDPNSSVNKRPVKSTPDDGYVPSYVDSYQNTVCGDGQAIRPVKVVTDTTQGNYYNHYNNGETGNNLYAAQPPQIKPMPILDATPEKKEPAYDTRYTDRSENDFSSGRFDERDADKIINEDSERNTKNIGEREDTNPCDTDNGYRRHDYMDLFSTSNPNLFGRGEEEFDRNSDRETDRNKTFDIGFETEERGTGVDDRSRYEGMYIFDDESELDRNSDRSSDRGEVNLFGGIKMEEDDGDSRGGFKQEDSRDALFEDNFNNFDRNSGFSDRSDGYDRNAGDRDDLNMSFERGDKVVDNGFSLDRSIVEDKREAPVVEVEEKPVPAPPKPRVIRPYVKVPLDDFDCRDVEPMANFEEVEETKANIIATLEDFKVMGASIASVTFGPAVTRYNVTIPRSISPKKVVALDQSIAISLHSSGVNIYPNYEDGVVSIEVPNKERQFVQLGCMLSGDTFVNAKPSSLMFAMGKDVANRKIYGDISKMIHLLVAGSTGSGKSVFLGALIISLIYKYSPEELRLILIDPKKTEFVLYNDLPHLMINEIITDVGKAVQSLNWAIGEMNRRYSLFEQMSRAGKYVVNLDQYNEKVEKSDRLPKIVIVIDELADLMLAAKKEMEDRIQNLTQKARAAGIHLIVATQRPSTDVITGVIKGNIPTRVAFYVATDVDSRVILDQTGAQKLLGKGDLLYTTSGLATPMRVQSAFISPEESQRVVNFIKNNNEAYYDEAATAFINSRGGYAGDDNGGSAGGAEKEVDAMHIEALRHVILCGSASISMIQRKTSAGYNRAGKIVEWMEDMGYISPFEGAKARKVLITKEEFESKYGPLQ